MERSVKEVKRFLAVEGEKMPGDFVDEKSSDGEEDEAEGEWRSVCPFLCIRNILHYLQNSFLLILSPVS